jgi:hypothetical protein
MAYLAARQSMGKVRLFNMLAFLLSVRLWPGTFLTLGAVIGSSGLLYLYQNQQAQNLKRELGKTKEVHTPNPVLFSWKKPLLPLPPVEPDRPVMYPVPVIPLYQSEVDYKVFRPVRHGPHEWTFYGTMPCRSH